MSTRITAFWCCQPQVVRIVCQSEQLQSFLIIDSIMTGKPRPVQSVFALLDPLLGRATTVVEPHYIRRFPTKVCHDETNSRKKLTRMPLHLRDDSSGYVPTGGSITRTPVQNYRFLRRTTHWTSQ